MKYGRIPRTDLEVSCLGLGTWVFGGDVWGGAEEKESLNAIQTALDQGINFIDTAPIYGDGLAESIVGKAIKAKPGKVILATKCGLRRRGNGTIKLDLSPVAIRGEIDESLRRLGVEQIDLYQCHWPDPNTPIEMTLEALLQIQAEGKIRHIGVSNFDRGLLEKASASAKIVTLQRHYSLLERTVEAEVLTYCRQNAVGFLAYGSLGGGILSGKYRSPKRFNPEDARNFFYKFYEGEGFKRTQKLIQRLGAFGHPIPEAALNWVRQQPGVTSVLVGCRNSEQVKANLLALDWDLSAQELDRISSREKEKKLSGVELGKPRQ